MLHKTKKHFFHTMQHQVYNERPALRTDQHYRAPTSIQSDNSLKNVALYHLHTTICQIVYTLHFRRLFIEYQQFQECRQVQNSSTPLSTLSARKGAVRHYPFTTPFTYSDANRFTYTFVIPNRQSVHFTHTQICYATGILRYRESGFSVGATKFSLPLYRKTRVAVQTKASGSAGKFHRYIHSLNA